MLALFLFFIGGFSRQDRGRYLYLCHWQMHSGSFSTRTIDTVVLSVSRGLNSTGCCAPALEALSQRNPVLAIDLIAQMPTSTEGQRTRPHSRSQQLLAQLPRSNRLFLY